MADLLLTAILGGFGLVATIAARMFIAGRLRRLRGLL